MTKKKFQKIFYKAPGTNNSNRMQISITLTSYQPEKTSLPLANEQKGKKEYSPLVPSRGVEYFAWFVPSSVNKEASSFF